MHNSLKHARYLSLTTFRRSGVPVNTPVWFAEKDDKYYIFSARDTGKVKRIRNSTRARIAACDVKGKVTGEWLEATCDFATHDEERLAYDLLVDKYGWQMKITNFFSRLSGKIGHRVVLVVSVNAPD